MACGGLMNNYGRKSGTSSVDVLAVAGVIRTATTEYANGSS
jgi:hypothetical protein